MLRNVLIVSLTGNVYFTKEFFKSGSREPLSASMLARLVTAMIAFSTHRVGVPVAYVALTNVGVAIQINSGSRLVCAVFHDIADGEDFGKLLAGELLSAFIAQYDQQLEEKNVSPDTFADFGMKIAEIVRSSVRPVLDNLQQQKGIECCVLTSSDTLLHSTAADIDKLSLLANHQALLGAATDLMATKNDVSLSVTLKGARSTIIMRRIERCSLVVLYNNNVNTVRCDNEINKSARLLQRILNMLSNLQDMISYR